MDHILISLSLIFNDLKWLEMPIYHYFGTSPKSLHVNLNIITYSDRYGKMWFFRVGINSKAILVDFIKMFERAKAFVLLFLLGEISNSKWIKSNGLG